MSPTPSLIKEISTDLKTLMEITPDPGHQADAARRDRALYKEIQSDKIHILHHPQV